MSTERVVAAMIGLLLVAAALRAARRSVGYLGSPIDVLSLYLGLWAAVLLLFAVPLIDYSVTPVAAWVAIYGAVATGAGACWLVRRRAPAQMPDVTVVAATLRSTVHLGRLRAAWAVSVVLGLAGMAGFVYAVSRVLPASAVFTDPEAVRIAKRDSAAFQDAYGAWKLLTYFNVVAFVLWSVALRTGAFRRGWVPAALLGELSLAPFLFTADRNLLVTGIVWAGALHLAWPTRLELRHALTVIAVVAISAGGLVTAVGNRYGGSLDAHPEIAEHLSTRSVDALAIPYLYVTGNLPAFGQLTEDDLAPLTLGQMTVLPLRKLVDAAGVPGEVPLATGVFYPIPFESFSNYSWLGTFWLDFRLPGVLLFTGLVTGLAAAFHLRVRRAPSLGTLWATSILLYVVALSPFANALTATLTWQFLLLTPVVALVVDRHAKARLSRLLGHMRARPAAVGVAACLAFAGAVAAMSLRRVSETKRTAEATRELEGSVARSRVIYTQLGRYPSPLGLATRLQANRPDLTFMAQRAYTDPVPPPGVIAVFSGPTDVFLRTRDRLGRLYEVHRTEAWGGVTFGPGTRDE